MTQPNPNEQQSGQQSSGGPSAKKSKFKPSDVVEYTHRDHLTGRDVTGLAVVIASGAENEAVTIRPLAHHHLEVAQDQLSSVSASDVG